MLKHARISTSQQGTVGNWLEAACWRRAVIDFSSPQSVCVKLLRRKQKDAAIEKHVWRGHRSWGSENNHFRTRIRQTLDSGCASGANFSASQFVMKPIDIESLIIWIEEQI